MELLFGSFNRHKADEIRLLLSPGIVLRCCADYPELAPVEETEDTLEGNALLKAQAYYQATGLPCFADDTGLEVEALQGAPGVFSARYAGEDSNAAANMQKLLRELAPHANRKAQFRTVIAYIDTLGDAHLFDGVLEGKIAHKPAGTAGFGYDPIFIPDTESTRTLAQHTAAQKNAISHRARALQAFLQFLTGSHA
ncbi:MAG: RdgB/HAM1 family non-canonical purine NTP pyrophosphatase [Bacteroidetes bacterium]|nr:RdgB/HAM1 family non-canonical purine NTP pyrophosphatase [Bacteroidota bacterium]